MIPRSFAEAALFFDPWSLEALNMVEQLKNSAVIQIELQEKGRERLRKFGAISLGGIKCKNL